MRPLLIVDAANVVGSVPDGWWRDRAGAARRLRVALIPVVTAGLPGFSSPPLEVVLVVEGAARVVAGDPPDPDAGPGVRVVAAAGSGDEAIIDLVRLATPGVARRDPVRPDDLLPEPPVARPVAVVTADRALREAVSRLGATVFGPRVLPHLRH